MAIPSLRRVIALALSAALVSAAPGLAPYEAFAQVVTRTAPSVAPVVPGAAGLAPVAAPTLAFSLAPSLPTGLSAGLTLPNAVVPRAAAAASAASAAPVARAAQAAPAAVLPAARPASVSLPLKTEAADAPRAEAVPDAFSSLQAVTREAAPARQGAAPTLESASSALFDGSARRPGLANAVAEPEGKGPARRGVGLALKRATAVGALVVGLRMAAPNIPGIPADTGFWTRALDVVGRGGYWLGNAMAFAFAVPQIYKTFRDGGAGKVPVWRAVVGASASLALGLLSAPLAKQMFWGVQNIFGGLALAAPILIGAYLARKGLKFSAKKAAALTAATATLLFAPAFAMYAAAAELVPAAINAAAAGPIALGLQIATGAAFFLLFVPDIIAIVKGRAPKGFTSMFSMLFALASIGFIAWTLQMAAAAPAGSSERVQFLIYAAQNAAYAVVSLLSWFYIRRAERKKA
ncbi:hypothetical protein EPO15_07270 [bacterium]|nr:MAG: hypothetical protein EPO15_07270 [bacterium]